MQASMHAAPTAQGAGAWPYRTTQQQAQLDSAAGLGAVAPKASVAAAVKSQVSLKSVP